MAKKSVNPEEIREVIAQKEQEIRNLEASLASVSSNIGDWKIAKYQEYKLMDMESPYDIEELHNKRQAVRDQINVLRVEIDELSASVTE